MQDSVSSDPLPLGLRHAGLVEDEIDSDKQKSIDRVLREEFRYEENRNIACYLYDLPFYQNYQLLRIRELEGGNRREGAGKSSETYALVSFAENGDEMAASFTPLSKSSAPIHHLNGEEGNLLLVDDDKPKELSEARVRSYLLFFTWAIQGNEGNFPIVLSKDEIDIGLELEDADEDQDIVGREELEKNLTKVDFGLYREESDEKSDGPSAMKWRATVAYSTNIFASEFKVAEKGLVEMLSDVAIVELPVNLNSSFDRGDQFELIRAEVYPRPGADEVAGDSEREEGLSRVSAAEFLVQWRKGDTPNCQIDGPVFLNPEDSDGHSMAASCQEVLIKNCIFEEAVSIVSERPDLIIRFAHCTFRQGVSCAGCEINGFLEFSDCLFEAQSVSAEEDLFIGPAVDLRNASIGALRLVRCGIAGRFYAPSLKVEGNLTLQGCRIGTNSHEVGCPVILTDLVEWSGRSFEAGIGFENKGATVPAIELSGARVRGDLELTAAAKAKTITACGAAQDMSAQIRGYWGDSNQAVRGLIVTAVRGECRLQNVEVQGRLFLFGFGCAGEVDLAGLQVGQLSTLPCRKFHHELLQNIKPIWPFCSISALQGPVHVGGHTAFVSVVVGCDLRLENSTFGGDLDLLSTSVSGELMLFFSEVKGWLRAIRNSALVGDPTRPTLEVGGELNFIGATLGCVQLRGISVKGVLKMGNGSVSSLEIGFGWRREKDDFKEKKKEDSKKEDSKKEDALWRIRSVYSNVGAVKISALSVANEVLLTGIRVNSLAKSSEKSGLQITQSRIGGDLRFAPKESLRDLLRGHLGIDGKDIVIPWAKPREFEDHKRRVFVLKAIGKDEGIDENQPSILDYPVIISGDLDLSANRIDGVLDLANVRVPKGRILLNDSTVGLDLNMSAQTDRDPDLISYSRLTTCCLGLDMEKIVIGGDADLTGLRVTAGEREDEPGDVHARDARVRGDVLLLPDRTIRSTLEADEQKILHIAEDTDGEESDASSRAKRWYAQIDGKLDFNALEAARLLIIGDNMTSTEKVQISRARIGHFEILEPTPGKLDLTNTEVSRWSVDDEEMPSANEFERVFRKLEPFDRAAWVTIEMRFRNRMQTNDANKVYRAMRKETRRDRVRHAGYEMLWEHHFHSARRKSDWWCVNRFFELKSYVGAVRKNPGAWLRDRVSYRKYLLWAINLEPFWWVRDFFFSLIGWGTRASIPFWYVWFPCFAAFCVILSKPENVEAGANLLQRPEMVRYLEKDESTAVELTSAGGSKHRAIRPDEIDVHWDWIDGTLLAARYGIPIANFFAHERWEASSSQLENPLFLKRSPEQLGGFLAILGWVSWPLLLIGIARSSVRERQS